MDNDSYQGNEYIFTREADGIQDDIDILTKIKREFIDLLEDVKRHVCADSFDKYAVAAEDFFDDILWKDFNSLVEEMSQSHGLCVATEYALPQSKYSQAYYAEQRRTTRQITNPATIAAIEAANVAASKSEVF